MTSSLNKEPLIPSGSDLRVLLNSDHISYGEVQFSLREKGIFVGNSDKAITVPLLSATLMKPDEFARLIEASIDRESRPKVKVSMLELVDVKADWVTALRNGSLFGDEFNPGSGITNGTVQFVSQPNLVIENKDKIRVPYSLTRKDFSRDWIEREMNFDGEVIVERQGTNLKLDFLSTHSSKETEAINRKITARISQVLSNAHVSKNDSPRRITFDAFSNVERVRFFKRLTAGLGKKVKLGSVNDMEVSRDESAGPLPDDPKISWMNQTVRRIRIDGERLNDIFLIAEEQYYPYYHVLRMDVTYEYEEGANKGTARVGFAFSSSSRSEETKKDAELTMDFVRITHEASVNVDSRKEIEKMLEKNVRTLVENEFERVGVERSRT